MDEESFKRGYEQGRSDALIEAEEHVEFLIGKWRGHAANVHPNDQSSLEAAEAFLANL